MYRPISWVKAKSAIYVYRYMAYILIQWKDSDVLSGFILMYIAISCMTVYVLYIEHAVSHSLWLFPMWLDAHQNPLSSLACNAQQNLSDSSITPSDFLFPIVYCSTAPSVCKLFLSRVNSCCWDLVEPHKRLNFCLSDSRRYKCPQNCLSCVLERF